MKNLSLSLLTIFLLTACETGYMPDKNATTDENPQYKLPHKYKASYIEEEEEPSLYHEKYEEEGQGNRKFTGGTRSDGLDLRTIRVNDQGDSVRLVFDSYDMALGDKVDKVGAYDFVYYPEKRLISGVINGYRGFSAKLPLFERTSIVEKMYMDEYLDDSGYRFHIKLRYSAEVKVFTLENPGRIVVDMVLP
jgi:hypothetical protein